MHLLYKTKLFRILLSIELALFGFGPRLGPYVGQNHFFIWITLILTADTKGIRTFETHFQKLNLSLCSPISNQNNMKNGSDPVRPQPRNGRRYLRPTW